MKKYKLCKRIYGKNKNEHKIDIVFYSTFTGFINNIIPLFIGLGGIISIPIIMHIFTKSTFLSFCGFCLSMFMSLLLIRIHATLINNIDVVTKEEILDFIDKTINEIEIN